jgi:hypothetical protein
VAEWVVVLEIELGAELDHARPADAGARVQRQNLRYVREDILLGHTERAGIDFVVGKSLPGGGIVDAALQTFFPLPPPSIP